MHRFLLTVFATALSSAAQFPGLDGETLTGKRVIMPEAAKGHTTLLIIGFTRASSRQTGEWAVKTRSLSVVPMFEVWSLAVLEDVPRVVRGIAVRGIKAGVPETEWGHFLVVYKNEPELKESVQFREPADDAWIVLLGPDGSVRWRSHGPFSEAAFAGLRKQIN